MSRGNARVINHILFTYISIDNSFHLIFFAFNDNFRELIDVVGNYKKIIKIICINLFFFSFVFISNLYKSLVFISVFKQGTI